MEKKQLKIFVLTAFVLPYVLGLLMGIGYYHGADVSLFPTAQMHYPAAGVMLAMLITRREDPMLPRRFFTAFLGLTAVMILFCIASILVPSSGWAMSVQAALILGNIICWIFYLSDHKEKRRRYGLRLTGNGKRRAPLYVLLFLALYMGRLLATYLVSGEASQIGELFGNPYGLINLIAMPFNFFLVFTAFFGEEYGWRGFLQPILQKRFGAKAGVILLGVFWGLWHLPINIFYYSPDTWLQSIVSQQITCIPYAVFFGFVYIKTQNIWIVVILHYINNNIIAVFNASADLSGQIIRWNDLLFLLITAAVFYLPFLLTEAYRGVRTRSLPAESDK